MSIDFGTQIDGRIIDCAWTLCFQEQFDPLLEATREATDVGIRTCGIDVPLNEVGSQHRCCCHRITALLPLPTYHHHHLCPSTPLSHTRPSHKTYSYTPFCHVLTFLPLLQGGRGYPGGDGVVRSNYRRRDLPR